MGKQSNDPSDDTLGNLRSEYMTGHRSRVDTSDVEVGSEDARRQLYIPTLVDIRALLDNGQARHALPYIEDYLVKNPHDADAQLLKAEICLELGVQTAFVGKALADLAESHAARPPYQRLAAGIEQAIREKLEGGRSELGYRLNEALRNFGIVADYATTDPAATMAVVLALLKHLDFNKRAVPATAKLRAALDRFTLLTIERSQAGAMAHEESIRYRVYLMLHEGRIQDAATWLDTTISYSRYHDHLQAATLERAIYDSLDALVGLIRNGQLALAHEIIQTGLAAADDNPTMTYFAGEIALIEGRNTDALALFETVTRTSRTGKRITDRPTHQRIWQLVSSAVVLCPACGKVVPLNAQTCGYCNQTIVEHTMVIDRYHLNTILDHENMSLVAEAGQAHTLILLNQPQTALEVLDGVLARIPDNSAAHKDLAQLQADIQAAHAEIIVERSAPRTEQQPDLVEVACATLDQLLAQPVLDVTSLLILRASFLPDSITNSQRREINPVSQAVSQVPATQLPLKLRQAIIKRLIKERHLEFARDLLAVLFADNPARKSVLHLSEMLERAIATTLEIWLDEADALMEQGMAEQVLALCEDALALYPNHPIALLTRGRARRHLGADLAALDDFYHVLRLRNFHKTVPATTDGKRCPFLRQTRILAAESLEARWETTQALELLEGLEDVEALRAKIIRRQADMPAVRLMPASAAVMTDTLVRVPAPSYAHAYFAVAVRSVGRMTSGAQAWAERVLMAGYEFVQVLGGLRNSVGEPVFALRLISTPHPHLSERGLLTLAIVVRTSADDATNAEQMARQLWMTLKEILPLRREFAFIFEPVIDENELDSLLMPFEFGAIAEIVRREDLPSAGNDRYAVYPYTPPLGLDMHNLCWALLRQPGPAMVSIHLLPTTLMAWERTALNDQMASNNKPNEPQYDRENVQYDRVAAWWQETPRWGQAQANRYLVDALSLHAYILQVNVVGSAQMNPLFPEQIAASLFGPPRTSGEARYGGYEIIRASRQDEFAIACRNLQTIDVERWVYTAAPEDAPRLRHLVTENEAAIAFRLPVPGVDGLPGMGTIDAKPIPPPSGMPASGTLIGESVARMSGAPIRIIQSTDDRRRHVYIVGKTGTGKSTLIKGMALQDIEAGHGVCVVDPHGDLIEDILLRIPPHRADDVIVFDPADEARPIGLNLLAHQHESERHQVVNEFIGLLMRMYDPGGTNMVVGPRFQHNVRMAMLTAMSVPGSTLIEVVRALTDQQYVKSVMPQVTDPMVRMYWEKQIAQTSDFHKSEVLDYIVSKFSRFTGDKRVRNIIGQSHSTVDFRRVMDHRQVLLVNLSKGKIGPENAQFLGLLMVQQLLLTALSRADLPATERPDFYLYVDEFQNFATEMFGTMLSEGRKYGVALTIANQYLTQLPHPIREAIFGNVGSIVSFRLGTQDATALAPELYPVFGVDDLLNLPRYTASVKLLVDGLAARPFTMRTVPDLHAPNPALADSIRERSRSFYGRDEQEVTEEVLCRLKARG